MSIPKIAPQRKRSLVAAEVLRRLIISQYSVGDKLPPERQLAQMMDISRNTLREAIAALQLMGILEVRHSLGNFVVSIPKEDQKEELGDILTSIDNPFEEVDTRIALEPGIVWLAVERITSKELEALTVAYKALDLSLSQGNTAEYAQKDADFHLCIAKGAHNAQLSEMLEKLLKCRRSPVWSSMKQGLNQEDITKLRRKEHKAIFDAIRNRDQELAARSMREHLESSLERFLIDVESKNVN